MRWWPPGLSDEACAESYKNFDKYVRPLPKKPDGSIKVTGKFHDNDIDAFRHAYVSGVMTQEYNETIAELLGDSNEVLSFLSDSRGDGSSKNMDLWNNAIGRRYGLKTRTRKTLAMALIEAMKRGEMILHPSDKRKYKGSLVQKPTKEKPIMVLKENKTGRNEKFYDTVTHTPMTRLQFVKEIKAGNYPGYRVAKIHGKQTPVSKRDKISKNNLG